MTSEQYAAAYSAGFDRTIAFLCSRGIRREDAEDVAQEAWVKGWIRRNQIRQVQSAAVWVNSIALNIYRVKLRSADALQWRNLFGTPRAAELELEGSRATEIDTYSMDLRKLMRMVPDRDRQVMLDYYVDGYSGPELSERYDENANTVKIRIMRASRKLAKRVNACGKRR